MQKINSTVGLLPLTRASTQTHSRADLINQVQVIAETNPGKARELHRRILFCTWNRFELQKLQREGLNISKIVPIKGLPGGGDMKMVITMIITCVVASSVLVYFYLLEVQRDEQFKAVMHGLHSHLDRLVEKSYDITKTAMTHSDKMFDLHRNSVQEQLERLFENGNEDLLRCVSPNNVQQTLLESNKTQTKKAVEDQIQKFASNPPIVLPREIMEELAQVFIDVSNKESTKKIAEKQDQREAERVARDKEELNRSQIAHRLGVLDKSLERPLGENMLQFDQRIRRDEGYFGSVQHSLLIKVITAHSSTVVSSLSRMAHECRSLINVADFAPERISLKQECDFSMKTPELLTSWVHMHIRSLSSFAQVLENTSPLKDARAVFHQNIVLKITHQLDRLFDYISTYDNARQDVAMKEAYRVKIDLMKSSFINEIDQLQDPLIGSLQDIEVDTENKISQHNSFAGTLKEIHDLIVPDQNCTKFWNTYSSRIK